MLLAGKIRLEGISAIWKVFCAFFANNTGLFLIFYRECRLKFVTGYDKIENGVIRLVK